MHFSFSLSALFVVCLMMTDVAVAQSLRVPKWNSVRTPSGVTFKQLAVRSDDEVWGLDSDGSAWLWNGVTWEKKACCVSSLSVAADGALWATNPENSGKLLRVLKLDVANNKWTWKDIPVGMKQVAGASATEAWGLDQSGALFKLNGTKWEKQDKGCCVDQISIGPGGDPFGASVSAGGHVSRWTGSGWVDLPGNHVFVSAGVTYNTSSMIAANVWALDSSGKAQWFAGNPYAKDFSKTGWYDAGTRQLINIAANSTGSAWGVVTAGSIVRWNAPFAEPCTQRRHDVTSAMGSQSPQGPIGTYVPQCTRTGFYAAKQCHGSTGFCWCVDPQTGAQVGEKVKDLDLTCSVCLNAIEKALSSDVVGAYVPQCDSKGSFVPLQEDVAIGDRWCVDSQTGDKKGAVAKKATPSPVCK